MNQILSIASTSGPVHQLRQSVLPVSKLILPSLMLSPVSVQLTGRVKDVRTARTNAVNVIAHPRGATVLKVARFLLHKLLETISGQRLITNVVRLVLFCK